MTTATEPRSTTRAQRPPLSTRLMRSTMRGLPPKRHEAGYESALPVPAADGSTLLTDHYFPLADGDFPTVLVRSPYGRGFPWAPLYGLSLAEQGFHVVLQSTRGTGGSGGTFRLWQNEAADGRATVAWLREQPWFNGALGTIGPSYMSYVQWALAADPPPELRAMVIHVGMQDPHRFFWPGGAFSLENALTATMGMRYQGQGFKRFLRATLRLQFNLRKVLRTLPLSEVHLPAFGERLPLLDEAMTHPDADDPYWQGSDVSAVADTLAVPTFLVGGWYDVGLDQTLEQYDRLRAAGCPSSLLIGPWTHHTIFQQGWPKVFTESLGWLRAHLSDDPSGLRAPGVHVHVGGTNEWQDLRSWPATPLETRWHLHSEGSLSPDQPDALSASFRYNPADPTPSVGGALLTPKGGPQDNRALEARADVLTFTTPPLTGPVRVLGPVRAELRVTTGHSDLFARLCDVDPQGRSTNICDGILRLAPTGPDPVTVTVPMTSAAHTFRPGHRIRLQLSGGAYPRFARNPGTGEPTATATGLVPTEVSLHHPSALVLG